MQRIAGLQINPESNMTQYNSDLRCSDSHCVHCTLYTARTRTYDPLLSPKNTGPGFLSVLLTSTVLREIMIPLFIIGTWISARNHS
jgi:hypothetical protein